jgi:hypothetical protein
MKLLPLDDFVPLFIKPLMKFPGGVQTGGLALMSQLLVFFRTLFFRVHFHLNRAFHVIAVFPALIVDESFEGHDQPL